MESNLALTILTALGNAGRLAVFRLLMRHYPGGVRPTDISAALGIKPNTLSNYLSELEHAGLVSASRQGRTITYSVGLDQLSDFMRYLGTNCFLGRPDLAQELNAGPLRLVDKPYNVLFVCSRNSARSVFAEALLREKGAGRFNAYSAGMQDGSQIHPLTLYVLAEAGLDDRNLRSKHVSEFYSPDAPKMDFVFTVCDAAASNDCAPWPGNPMTAHWGVSDPVTAQGGDAQRALAFTTAYSALNNKITAFAGLAPDQLDRVALQHRLDDIGRNQKSGNYDA